MGDVLIENRHGLGVEAKLTRAAGLAERLAALELAPRARPGLITVGADQGYDAADVVMELGDLGSPRMSPRRPRARAPRSIVRPRAIPAIGRAREPDRGDVCEGQDHRRAERDQVPQPRASALAIHPRHGRLQPDSTAPAAGGAVIRPQPAAPPALLAMLAITRPNLPLAIRPPKSANSSAVASAQDSARRGSAPAAWSRHRAWGAALCPAM